MSRAANSPVGPDTSPTLKQAVVDATRELAALNPRVPSVIIQVIGAKASKVTIDDVEVPAVVLGVVRPTDPGCHVIRASADGLAPAEVIISLLEGRTERVSVELKPNSDRVPPPEAAQPLPARSPSLAAPPVGPSTPSRTSNGQKMLGYSALGLGAAGLVVGGVAGGLALTKHNEITSACGGSTCPASWKNRYQSEVDTRDTLGTASTAGFIVGGAVAAAGVVLLLTAPRASTSSGSIEPLVGLGFIGAKGTF